MSDWRVDKDDCIKWLNGLPADCADLVFGSPPYVDARLYLENGQNLGVSRGAVEWVEWMLEVTKAAVRVSKGLVLWVAAGVQRKSCYWPVCEGLMWEWWRRGNQLWRPSVWWKVDSNDGGTGIPGSGGKQYLRNDWEFVMAFKREGHLPWADNTAMGHPPIYDRVGGAMSNRTADGRRINARPGVGVSDPWRTATRGGSNIGGRNKDGSKKCGPTRRQNGEYKTSERERKRIGAKGQDGKQHVADNRPMPKLANPGNVVRVDDDENEYSLDENFNLIVKARVGGGHIGSRMAHDGEAPFPEKLAQFFIRSFAPPGGLVVDPFCGTGTTLAVAVREGRRAWGCDLRASQVELSRRRVTAETPTLFPGEGP